MEYAKGGELLDYIVKKKRLDESEAAYFYVQLISGIETIHSKRIVHRDIKPENILIKENNILSIIDFGLSNTYKKGQLLSSACGSQCYEAPEMLLGKKYNGLSVDIWSSGIVLYAMVCGYLPFEEQDEKLLVQKITEGKFDIPRHLGADCRNLILQILEVDPRNRISLENIKRHPFLEKAYKEFGDGDYHFISSPGRSEIGGNHTDHQRGRVLAASVNIDTIAVVAGVWKDTVGVVQRMDMGKQTATINVELFGRETPVELEFAQVVRV